MRTFKGLLEKVLDEAIANAGSTSVDTSSNYFHVDRQNVSALLRITVELSGSTLVHHSVYKVYCSGINIILPASPEVSYTAPNYAVSVTNTSSAILIACTNNSGAPRDLVTTYQIEFD